jgi:hypothetical protein
MKSLYDFIVKPLNDRYENKIKVDNKELILNTKIEDHVFVSKKAIVVSTPAAFKTSIDVGDEVYIHHNILEDGMMLKVEKETVLLILKMTYIFVLLIKYIYIKKIMKLNVI